MLLLVLGCGGSDSEDNSVDLPFSVQFGGAPLECGVDVSAGSPAAPVSVSNLRFFVHDVFVSSGTSVARVVLSPDGVFQSESLALMDMTGENCTGAQHTTLSGTVGLSGPYDGLHFTVGVPTAQNHLDAAEAEPPLDDPRTWWGWRMGYVHLRADFSSGTHASWGAHYGAADCEGTGATATCLEENLVEVDLALDPANGVLVDLDALTAAIDFNAPLDEATNPDAGCFGTADDPDCLALTQALESDDTPVFTTP